MGFYLIDLFTSPLRSSWNHVFREVSDPRSRTSQVPSLSAGTHPKLG